MAAFQDFGAVGDGITDDTIAVQSALTAGGLITDDGKAYLISAPLVINTGVQLQGVKQRSKFIAAATFPAGSDILTIRPLVVDGPSVSGYKITDFSFIAQAGSGQRHTLAVDTSQNAGVYVSQFHMSGCIFAAGGTGYDFAHIPHATDANGFFCSTIAECVFTRGMYLDKAGDSLNIQRNVFTGSSPNPGIYLNQVPGASHCVIESNNFTASGGAIYSLGTTNLRVLNNQIEQTLPYNGPVGGGARGCVILYGTLSGGVWTKAVMPIVRGNNINTHGANAPCCVAVVSTNKAIIRENCLQGTEVNTNGLDTGTLINDNF